MTLKLEISNHSRRAVNSRWLYRQLHKLLKLQRISAGSWSITIVNDKEMAALHKRTMDDPTTTDVLTFDMSEPPASARDQSHKAGNKIKTRKSKIKNPLDLDTILCADVAARTAESLGHSVNHELLLYALHSLLHVLGYDDLTPADFEKMHRREDELLIASGLNPLFGTHSTATAPRPKSRPVSKKRNPRPKRATVRQ